MASRAEILSATKSRANKKSTLARNGRWNTSSSGAFLRAPQVTRGPGSAGSGEQAKANFFKAIIEDVIPAAKKIKDQKDKERCLRKGTCPASDRAGQATGVGTCLW